MKIVAFRLPKDYPDVIGSSEPQHFGVAPGLYLPGVPVTLAEMGAGITDDEMRDLIEQNNLPLEEVKVDADYKPKKGQSQFELLQKGEGSHAPAGPVGIEVIARRSAGAKDPTFRSMSVGELRLVAEQRGIATEDEDGKARPKNELLADLEADAPSGSPEDLAGSTVAGTDASVSASTAATGGTVAR